MTRELLIGCGSKQDKVVQFDNRITWDDCTTLDINSDHNPDVVWDLNQFPYPFESEQFDEIHAYHVLEHVGAQGDYQFFFKQWSEFYRLLKPNGVVCGIVPHWTSKWAWGDPSHTRIISSEQLTFLNQANYAEQVGKTNMTDFRYIYRDDFIMLFEETREEEYIFVLQAIKPSRYVHK